MMTSGASKSLKSLLKFQWYSTYRRTAASWRIKPSSFSRGVGASGGTAGWRGLFRFDPESLSAELRGEDWELRRLLWPLFGVMVAISGQVCDVGFRGRF